MRDTEPDFTAFADRLTYPSLKLVAAHWLQARQDRKMPAWADIKPAAIVRALPIVWAYKYDPKTDEFVGRLAGERITQAFGKSFRGLRLSEAQPADAVSWIYDRFKRVVTEPAAYECSGCLFKQAHDYGIGERLVLPLSTDGIISDGILGVTEYERASSDLISLIEPAAGKERWFSLA